MRARTHVWIADQAIGIVAADGRCAALAELLRRHVKEMWLGASWLPDVCFGDVNTAHVCRTATVRESDPLPRRVNEVFEAAVAHVSAKNVPFTEAQAALGFFILSHYVADANCPLHVDVRITDEPIEGRIGPALHHEVEGAWEEWFREISSRVPVLTADGDSPLSTVSAVASTRFAASPSLRCMPAAAARQIVQRARLLATKHIPDGCADLARLDESLGPRGFEMLAADVFAAAVADVALFWREAWLKARTGAIAKLEDLTS